MASAFLIPLFVLLAAVPAGAQPADTYPLPGDEVYPEGIAYDPATGDFYVGSTSDGTVFRGNVAEPGTEAEVFLEGGADDRSTAIGMKVDEAGNLFIAGGDTGRMFVYDTNTGELVESLSNGEEMTFVNDVALAPDGSAYFTDSMSPELYRVSPDGAGGYELKTFVEFEGTALRYTDGFNLNGIVVTPDGRYLISVQSDAGELFRIDTQTAEVAEIDTGEAELASGDGLLLEGQTLYVVRNSEGLIVPVRLSADFASGQAGEPFTSDALMYPTTIAPYDGRLLAVNSQFDARESGEPELPFTVASVDIPDRALPESGGPPVGWLLPGAGLAFLTLAVVSGLIVRSRRGRTEAP